MDELWYKIGCAVGAIVIFVLRVQYAEFKIKLQQSGKLLQMANEILEDDEITVNELKRFVRQLQLLLS